MNWVAPIKDDETLQKFRDTLRSVDDKYYILFEIGIGTGLQLQDILQFKVKDVRGKDMLIAVIGTRQIEQAFPLKPELQAVITDFIDGRDDDEYLITGYASTNRPLSREQAYRIFKQTGNKIGLKSIGTQTMRKTFAWRYYKETGDIQYIQNLLNHASPNITFRYIGEKPNIKVIYDKITDDGNQKAMEYLLKDKKGVRDIDAIILELKQIRRKDYFLSHYFDGNEPENARKKILVYQILMDYLWAVWTCIKEAQGDDFGTYGMDRYTRAIENLKKIDL